MSSYADELAWLYTLRTQGVRYELGRMQSALAAVGSPQDSLRVVHVAGTNGKGSVCALIEAALREAGYKTGFYSSPHVHHFAERIRIRGVPVTQETLHQKISAFRQHYSEMPLTFFEATTLFAWEIFRDEKCDIVIAEVGLGGRLDATNVLTPELSVITEIGYDHQQLLGDTLSQIAREKAAIIKAGRPSIIGCTSLEAREVAQARAKEVGSCTKIAGEDFGYECTSSGLEFWSGKEKLDKVELGLRGDHQLRNAAVAFAALQSLNENGWKVPPAAIREAFRSVGWPGRLEWLADRPRVLLDAAHNESGCAALAEYLKSIKAPAPRVLLFGAMRDKNISAMLNTIGPWFDHRVYTSTELERAADPEQLAHLLPGEVVQGLEAALDRSMQIAGDTGTVVVAGSLFLVAAVRSKILQVTGDPLIAF